VVPSRDVLHIPFNTDRHPLVGDTPLTTAALAISTNTTISAQAATFFKNMSRASGVLVTDERLTGEQIDTLRQKWLEQSAGLNSGGVPILASGLKWQNLSVSAHDSEIINTFKMTVEDISRAMRVPLPLLNALDSSTYNNTEALMRFWLSSGLGFLLEHIEESFDRMFKIPEGQYLAFDTSPLLRMDLKGRMEALGTAVTKGIMSPNEARAREGLPSVEGGDMPRVQQQMVPLDFVPPVVPTPAPPPDDSEPDAQQPEAPQNQEYAPMTLRALKRLMGEVQNAA
jgi:HK97 family phage portal protein